MKTIHIKGLAWLVADWFIAKPRCLQGPFERYWHRIMQRETITTLNTDLAKNLIDNKKIDKLKLFGIKR